MSAHRGHSQAAHTGRDLASMAEARALAPRTTPPEAELAEFSHEHLDDLRVIFGSEVAVKGLYSTLIPELSQPAFE